MARSWHGIRRLRGLVLSIQPVRGGHLDTEGFVEAFARIGGDVGACALRVEGLRDLRAARRVTDLPIVGLTKRPVKGSEVIITPEIEDVDALARAGADLVAVDATDRPRPTPAEALLEAIHGHGLGALADVSSHGEGARASALGFDLVATTLSGYVGAGREAAHESGPDLDLVRTLARAGVPVVAEGRIRSPVDAAKAVRAGALAVTVGTALTRPDLLAMAFARAVAVSAPGGDDA